MIVRIPFRDEMTYYLVSWQHNRRGEGWSKNAREHTHCYIRRCDEHGVPFLNTEIYVGIAKCSLKDQYDKDTGRIKSMTQALWNISRKAPPNTAFFTMPKRCRTACWDTYKRTIGIRALKGSEKDTKGEPENADKVVKDVCTQ